MRSHDACTSTSHSSIVAAVEDGGSYSSSRRLWSVIFDKVFEYTEHSSDRNSSSAVPAVFPADLRSLLHKIVMEHLLFINCAPGGCQSSWHQNKKQSAWRQYWQYCGPSFLIRQEFPVRSESAFSECQRGRYECYTVIPIPAADFYDTGIQKLVPQ